MNTKRDELAEIKEYLKLHHSHFEELQSKLSIALEALEKIASSTYWVGEYDQRVIGLTYAFSTIDRAQAALTKIRGEGSGRG